MFQTSVFIRIHQKESRLCDLQYIPVREEDDDVSTVNELDHFYIINKIK